MTTTMFRNPVGIYRGEAAPTLRELVNGTLHVLVTSRGWRRRGVVEHLRSTIGQPAVIFDQIRENPTLQDLASLDPALADLRSSPGAVVALGGGSVIDAAKAIASALASGATMSLVAEVTRAAAPLPAALRPWPIYCVPTTAGTGSEVTSTATLWDGQTGDKYSLADERLFPRAAVLDSSLLMTAPADLTLSTALDALSHAMESVWSKRHNPLSDACAAAAIRRVRRYLPIALQGGERQSRHELQTAALMAGFAISATRTGLAHSISYPLTGSFGLRHGLACSFTLPSVAAFVLEGAPERARIIAEAFGVTDVAELSPALREWMERLGVYAAVRRVIDLPRVLELGDTLLAKGRADNGLRPATRADAQRILREALSESPQGECTAPPRAPGRVVWITGLSGAGKSTLARALTHRLRASGREVLLLDGDDLRRVFRSVTGYSEADRRELAAHYSRLCRLLSSQGADVVCATMALFHDCRQWNRENIPRYLEVYLKVEPAVLIARDPKGLYSKALRGEIRNLPGIDQPYEAPQSPDIVIDKNRDDVDLDATVTQVLARLEAAC